MTPSMVEKAQVCLSVENDGHLRKIIDIENLFYKHNTERVLELLHRLFLEYQHKLKQMVINDKTSGEIDDTVARMFRVHMAIRAIENDLQEVIVA